MQRPGKLMLIFFFLCLTLPAWASVPVDSVHKTSGQPTPVPKGHHLVQKGDTYYGLSRRYQVAVDSLKKWNGESPRLGSIIQVASKPGAGKATSLPVAAAKAPADPKPVAKAPATPAAPAKKPAATPKATAAVKPGSTTRSQYSGPAQFAPEKKEAQRILVIPFDPYLYFSDADEDIAWQSRIPRQNVRYIFRTRLNAFMDPKGFESINLLGGAFQNDKSELDLIYKSVSYSYQPVTVSKYNPTPVVEKPTNGAAAWIQKQKDKIATPGPTSPEAAGNAPSAAKDPTKYYGVRVKNQDLYRHFNENYAVDYYLFINQFEIHTDFTNCLDRTKNDFVREFLVHYTILDKNGNLIAGNKVRVPYISHVNEVEKIVRDNLNQMAQRILADLPRPAALSAQVPNDK